jgi:prevent-host-death family protein
MEWQLAEAKNKFSELVNRTLTEGPQRVRRRGDVVVVVSGAEWERVTGKQPDFIEFLLSAPDMSDLDLTRDKTPMRNYDWGGDGE